MKRRAFLGSLLAGIGSVAGCLEERSSRLNPSGTTQSDESNTDSTTIGETTTSTPFETHVNGTRVTLEVLDRQMPAPDPSVTGEFDCEASEAVLTGWLRPPNGCHELVFESLTHDTETSEATVALTSRSESKAGTTCEGVKYEYQITLTFESEIPETIRVRYDSPANDSVESFAVEKSC